jgi:hypothetical protein
MAKEAVAQVSGVTLWRCAEEEAEADVFFLVEEPSRGRITWRFPIDQERLAWQKFDERALSRTVLDLR